MEKYLQRLSAIVKIVIAISVALLAYQNARSHSTPSLSTPYQAVVLMNGQVFFGKLEGLESEYPVLRDVFYIQARQNPETKQVANVLIKRGGEAHGPDRMILNRLQVQMIEPVKEDSQIAKLIAEQNQAH